MQVWIDDLRRGQLDSDFPDYVPKFEDAERYVAITQAAKDFARAMIENVPWSTDRDYAVQLIREAAMYAKDAILSGKGTTTAMDCSNPKGRHNIELVDQ